MRAGPSPMATTISRGRCNDQSWFKEWKSPASDTHTRFPAGPAPGRLRSGAAAVILPPGGGRPPANDTGRGGEAKKCTKRGLIAMTGSSRTRRQYEPTTSSNLSVGFYVSCNPKYPDTDPQYRPGFWSLELDWLLTPTTLAPTYTQCLSHSLLPRTRQESTQRASGARWWVSCTVYTRCRGPAYLPWCQLRPRN